MQTDKQPKGRALDDERGYTGAAGPKRSVDNDQKLTWLSVNIVAGVIRKGIKGNCMVVDLVKSGSLQDGSQFQPELMWIWVSRFEKTLLCISNLTSNRDKYHFFLS